MAVSWCVVSACHEYLPFSFLSLFLHTKGGRVPWVLEFVRICRRRDRQTTKKNQDLSESFFMFLTTQLSLTALPSITIHRSHYLIAGSEENKRENMAPNVTEKTSLVKSSEDDETMKKLKAYQP